jgi:5-methylcytosine-specific restriction endonuclease McrA
MVLSQSLNSDAFVPKHHHLSYGGVHISKVDYSSLLPHLASTSDDNHRHEIMFEHDSPGAGGAPIPQRQKKHRHRRKKTRTKRTEQKKFQEKGPVSSDEIASHVSSKYISGNGGKLHRMKEKRKRQVASSLSYETDPQHMDHVAYLRKLDRHPALVLNADYQPLSVLPLSIWSWQETVKSVFSGKVVVVDVYADINIKAVNLDMPLPSVIALTDYVSRPSMRPAFTRRNVFLRDGYQCQYCGGYFQTQELTLDHVMPRCMGGKLNWENAVTCCKKCNSKKGSHLPSELRKVGMKLINEPRVPTKFELAAQAGKMKPRRVHQTWKPFLGLHETPESVSEQLDEKANLFFDEIDRLD